MPVSLTKLIDSAAGGRIRTANLCVPAPQSLTVGKIGTLPYFRRLEPFVGTYKEAASCRPAADKEAASYRPAADKDGVNFIRGVDATGSTAFLASSDNKGSSHLQIVDISVPSSPALLASLVTPERLKTFLWPVPWPA